MCRPNRHANIEMAAGKIDQIVKFSKNHQPIAYLPFGQIGHGPPLAKNFFFDIVKNLENIVWLPFV